MFYLLVVTDSAYSINSLACRKPKTFSLYSMNTCMWIPLSCDFSNITISYNMALSYILIKIKGFKNNKNQGIWQKNWKHVIVFIRHFNNKIKVFEKIWRLIFYKKKKITKALSFVNYRAFDNNKKKNKAFVNI